MPRRKQNTTPDELGLSGAGITWCVSAAQPLVSSLQQQWQPGQRCVAVKLLVSCFSEQLLTQGNCCQSWYFFACLLTVTEGQRQWNHTDVCRASPWHWVVTVGSPRRAVQTYLSQPQQRENFNSYLLFDHDFSSVAPSGAWGAWLLFPVQNLGRFKMVKRGAAQLPELLNSYTTK